MPEQQTDTAVQDSTTPAEIPTGGQTLTNDWRSSLSEEYREHPSLKDYKDVNGVVKTMLSAQEALGSRVKIPDKEAKKEDWDKFYEKIGRPETPDKYDFSDISNAPLADAEGNKELVSKFKEWAHEYGVPQRAAAGIVDKFLGMSQQIAEQRAMESEQNVNLLKREFGAAFDQRVQLANETFKKMVEKSGGDWNRVSSVLAETGLDSQPDLVMAFSTMGRMMAQDKIWGAGGEPRGMTGSTPSEARAEIEAIKAEYADDLVRKTPVGEQKQKRIDQLLEFISAT